MGLEPAVAVRVTEDRTDTPASGEFGGDGGRDKAGSWVPAQERFAWLLQAYPPCGPKPALTPPAYRLWLPELGLPKLVIT